MVGTLDDQKADIIRAMESVNSLTATLNREKQTVSGALDVAGPAVKVLADQHDELIAMLPPLDRLGVVGTRVIKRQQGRPAQVARRTSSRCCPSCSDAGDQLAPGLNLLISFPFPKEAVGDRPAATTPTPRSAPTSTSRTSCPRARSRTSRSGLPTPDPAGRAGAHDVQKCLRSGDLTSQACQKVLADLDLLTSLKKKCKKNKYKQNPVCQVLNSVPDVPLDELGDVLGGIVGGILGRSSTTSASAGEPSSEPSMRGAHWEVAA